MGQRRKSVPIERNDPTPRPTTSHGNHRHLRNRRQRMGPIHPPSAGTRNRKHRHHRPPRTSHVPPSRRPSITVRERRSLFPLPDVLGVERHPARVIGSTMRALQRHQVRVLVGEHVSVPALRGRSCWDQEYGNRRMIQVGSLFAGRGPGGKTATPIADLIDASGDCWEWTGWTTPTGYGRAYWNGRQQMAHRIVWETLVGEIANGMEIDHLCKVRRCVNPDHLRVVTRADNNKAKYASRSVCTKGHDIDGFRAGRRYCKTCHAQSSRAARQRKRTP